MATPRRVIFGGIIQLEIAKIAISRIHCFIIMFQPLVQEPKCNELALPAGRLWGDPSVKN